MYEVEVRLAGILRDKQFIQVHNGKDFILEMIKIQASSHSQAAHILTGKGRLVLSTRYIGNE